MRLKEKDLLREYSLNPKDFLQHGVKHAVDEQSF